MPPGELLTAVALTQRAEVMFLHGEEAPSASGHGPAAATATYGLVATINDVARALWEARGRLHLGRAADQHPRP